MIIIYGQIKNWTVLLIEAGSNAIHFLDVPITAQLLQASEYNWKYRTIPMNTSCLSEKPLFYVSIFESFPNTFIQFNRFRKPTV